MNRQRLSIVIVNYRTADLVVDCLHSLEVERQGEETFDVIVTDNASPDDSVAVLRQAIDDHDWSSWVTLMPLERNGGFAYGNNAAIRQILESSMRPDYVLLLNPDTVVRPGAIAALTRFMDEHERAGIAGSRLLNPDGSIESSARRFPTACGEFVHAARSGPISRLFRNRVYAISPCEKAHRCDWVSGAAMVIRLRVFEDIGLMDEKFFLYYEEVDFCRQARTDGWDVYHVPQSQVVHDEGAATGVRQRRRRRGGYWYDSRRRYFIKHHGRFGLIVADVCWVAGRSIALGRWLLRLGGSTQNDPSRFACDLLGGDLRYLTTGRLMMRVEE